VLKKIVNQEPSDTDFVEGLKSNSEIQLEALYKLHFPMVLQFILNNSGNEEDAKDVYQETIIVLYNKVQEGSFELHSKLKTFIYSVARRLWLKKLNSKHRKTSPIRDFEESIPVEDELFKVLEKEEHFKILQIAMEKLGQPCRALIEDFYMEGLSMEDLSEKFGYTNSENAKNQKYKCLLRLKKIFFIEFSKESLNFGH
jgi:RNA polymerase sigma factor (sigma-70 family)